MSSSILFCLQLCPIDAEHAVDLARLIAQIADENPPKNPPPWLISYRRDTPLSRVHSIKRELSRSFHIHDVWISASRHHGSGWPAGPNSLWRSTMEYAGQLSQISNIGAQGVLTFEPDCVPLTLDWIDRLQDAYTERGKPILGNFCGGEGAGSPELHVNGNSIFPIQLAKMWPDRVVSPPEVAWDYWHRDFFIENANDTPLIVQYYNKTQLTEAEWDSVKKWDIRPALLHGVKDRSGREWARKKLLKSPDPAPKLTAISRPRTPLPVIQRSFRNQVEPKDEEFVFLSPQEKAMRLACRPHGN
jgi:hypothetical protein